MSPSDLSCFALRQDYQQIDLSLSLPGGGRQHPSQLIFFYVILSILSTTVYHFDLFESDSATLGVIRLRNRVWLSVLKALSDYKPTALWVPTIPSLLLLPVRDGCHSHRTRPRRLEHELLPPGASGDSYCTGPHGNVR